MEQSFEANEAILREREKAVLGRILEQANFFAFDNYEWRGDGRSLNGGHNIITNEYSASTREEKGYRWQSGDTLLFSANDLQNKIVESVILSRVTKTKHKKEPVMKPVYKKRLLGGYKQVGEEVDYYSNKLVSKTPATHSEIVSGGSSEQAYCLYYGLLLPELGKLTGNYGRRKSTYGMESGFLLPESTAKEAFELIQRRPSFVREIFKAMISKIGEGGFTSSNRHEKLESDVFDEWIKKSQETTKMHVASIREDGSVESSNILMAGK